MSKEIKIIYRLTIADSGDDLIDDLYRLNMVFYGNSKDIAKLLNCKRNSVSDAAIKRHYIKGYSIIVWDKFYVRVPYGIYNAETNEPITWETGDTLFPIEILSKILGYSLSTIRKKIKEKCVWYDSNLNQMIYIAANNKYEIERYERRCGSPVEYYCIVRKGSGAREKCFYDKNGKYKKEI